MTRVVCALGLAVALAACADDGVDPITVITAPRVLAITTEPSALPIDGAMAMSVLIVDPDGPRVGIGEDAPSGERPVDNLRVRACAPWKFVSDPGRDCVGADALPLEVDAAGVVRTSAAALRAAFPGVPAAADPWRAALVEGLALRVTFIAEVEIDGETLVARRDVDVVEAGAERRNPRLLEIRFDGAPARVLRAGQPYQLTATVDRASLDEPPAAAPPGALERVVCHLYSPAGELTEPEISIEDPDAHAWPETNPGTYVAGPPGSTWVFVVATDETGGMAATSIPIMIE